MSDAVRIDFQVGAVREVHRAIDSISKALADLERKHATSARNETRARSGAAKAHEKAATDALKVAQRIAREEERATEKSEREKTRSVERWAKQRERIVTNTAIANTKAILREAEAEQRARERMNRALGGAVGRGVGGVLGGGAKLAGAVLGVGGGFGIASALGSEIQNRGKAREIAIQSQGALTADAVYSAAASAGTVHGKSTSDVLAGLDQFIAKSGDAKTATETMGELLKLSNATGASFEDLSRVAGQVFASDKTMGAEKLAQVMRDIAAQGRAGSVDMKELGQYAARLSGAAQEFGGDRLLAMRKLGGFAQLGTARGSAVGAAEATEAALSLPLEINKHTEDFAAIGVKTADKDGLLRPIDTLIRETVQKTGGDKGQLENLFGLRGYKAVGGYANTYLAAKAGGATNEQALGIADKALEEFSHATMSAAQVNRENAERMSEADKQLEAVMNDLRSAVGAELVPAFTRAIPTIKELVPQFASLLTTTMQLARFFAENPFVTLGAAVSTAITAEIAKAAIGSALQRAILTQTGASFATGIGVAAAAMTIAEVGMITIAKMADEDQKVEKTAGGRAIQAGNLAGQLRADLEKGKIDPEHLKAAKGLLGQLEGDTQRTPSAFKVIGGAAASLAGQGDAVDTMKREHYRSIDNSKQAFDMLTAAVQKAAAAMSQPPTAPHSDASHAEPMSSPRRGGTSK